MRVLVVEDEPIIAAQLAEALRAAGYAVDVVHNGVDAHFQGSDEAPVSLLVAQSDPRFSKPLSDLYWQIDRVGPSGWQTRAGCSGYVQERVATLPDSDRTRELACRQRPSHASEARIKTMAVSA